MCKIVKLSKRNVIYFGIKLRGRFSYKFFTSVLRFCFKFKNSVWFNNYKVDYIIIRYAFYLGFDVLYGMIGNIIYMYLYKIYVCDIHI